MPIPPLTEDGLLPSGIHNATIEEVNEMFGHGGNRHGLMARLREFLAELRQWQMMDELLLDGSFVTAEQDPHDIDMVLVFQQHYDMSREVSPYEYNLRSHRMVKKRFGFDLFAVRPNTPRYMKLIELFSQVKSRPDATKGIVRLLP